MKCYILVILNEEFYKMLHFWYSAELRKFCIYIKLRNFVKCYISVFFMNSENTIIM